jgi:polar amino acid transport system permease protein
MSFIRLWQVFAEYHDVLLSGIWVTVSLSILAMIVAVVVGLVACLGTLARSRLIRAPAVFYVEFCRNTPILVQLVWVHYALPEIIGIKFDA